MRGERWSRRGFVGSLSVATIAAAVGGRHPAHAADGATGVRAPSATFLEVEKGGFDPKGGHIQGAAASQEALYLTQMTCICKFDWSGKLLKKLKVLSHTGDACWHDGCLYTSVVPYGGPNKGKGVIQVFDGELKLLRETLVDRGLDGITYWDGTLYVGMGTKTQPSKDPHRVNIFGRFDPLTLKEIGPRQEVDFGYDTRYGAQNILTDGKRLFVNFYSVKGAPSFVAFDKDFKVLQTFFFGTGQGADVLPSARAAGKVRLFTVRTTGLARPKNSEPPELLGARIQFYDFDGAKFTAVK